jgi:hypothetical protein
MPVLGKEAEPHLSPEQIAVQEVQGYVEKIERRAEIQAIDVSQQPKAQLPNVQTKSDMGVIVSSQLSHVRKPNIVLPIDQGAIQFGLKKSVVLGVRWLSEWCVMMIKKYPGRVFYMPPETSQ